ncbi:MAG TPA: carboxypeptidase-like regulatory domain-containing protein [Tepidisphaeraceae bacterium]|jgi:5-hydroxyisourate hydrolase-like protein (transthyretin family)
MPALRTLLPAILLLACAGCLTNVRPTVAGQIVDADTARPVPGVAVSIHSVTSSTQPSEPLARTTSDADGKFACPGSQTLDIWWGYSKSYRMRFHRDGYDDAVYDFEYEVHFGTFGDRKPIGPIRMHPRPALSLAHPVMWCRATTPPGPL